jgi:hypothetical protein
MNRINLVVSHVLIAAAGVSIGYGLSLKIRPVVPGIPQSGQGQTTLANLPRRVL